LQLQQQGFYMKGQVAFSTSLVCLLLYLLVQTISLSFVDHRLVAPGKTRISARVSYDGSAFKGFQTQSDGSRTIQSEVERCIHVIAQERCRVVAASRTDAGVHSRGQAIHFDVPTKHWESNPQLLGHKLNSLLPQDVRLWNVSLAPEGTHANLPWNANIAATGKLYVYRWRVARHMDPLARIDRSLYYQNDLDVPKMRECLREFEGTRDFASFGNRLAHKLADFRRRYGEPDSTLSSTRTIKRINLVEEDDVGIDFRLEFELDGALYKMVRNIVGMIHSVGSGKMSRGDIKAVFALENRQLNPTRSAAANGLTLEHVFYDKF
jgi:tRNA pseudouridine38-40 synthase